MTQLSDLRQWHHKWETQSDEDMDGVPGQGNALGHPCRFFGAGHSTSAPKGKQFDLVKAACLLINTMDGNSRVHMLLSSIYVRLQWATHLAFFFPMATHVSGWSWHVYESSHLPERSVIPTC